MLKKSMLLLLALVMVLCAACAAPAEPKPDVEAGEPLSETEAAWGAAADDWTYLQEKGKLVVGITIYEPMNYYDNAGKLVGFDTEFAEALCAKLGLTPEFVEINWDTKEVELNAGNIDCIWNGLTVTDERKENMAFTQSYIKNMQVVVVKADSAYTDVASLAGKNLVAEISSAGESAIQADATLSQANYVAVDKQVTALMEVKSGTADAAVLDYVLAKAMVGEGTDYSELKMLPNVELAVEEYAIGLRLGSTAADAFNKAMDEMIADGSLDAIAQKYDLSASLLANQ